MKDPISIIADLGVPTESFSAAIHHFYDRVDFSKDRYESLIAEIIGLDNPPTFESIKEAKLYFLYTIQETVRAFNTGTVPDMDDLWDAIVVKTKTMIARSPWSIKEYDTYATGEPKLDAMGKPKPKKGAKKELARQVYLDNNHRTMKRKEWIELLMEKVGLSQGGASTYYANLKKEYS